MRTYMVEIQITEPKGRGLNDWGFVGRTYEDLPEHYTSADLEELNARIRQMIQEYEKEAAMTPLYA